MTLVEGMPAWILIVMCSVGAVLGFLCVLSVVTSCAWVVLLLVS